MASTDHLRKGKAGRRMRPCEVGGCGERYERHVIWRSGRGGGFTVWAVSLRVDSVTLVLPLAPGKVIEIQKEGREKINLLTSNSGNFVGAPRPAHCANGADVHCWPGLSFSDWYLLLDKAVVDLCRLPEQLQSV